MINICFGNKLKFFIFIIDLGNDNLTIIKIFKLIIIIPNFIAGNNKYISQPGKSIMTGKNENTRVFD